MNAAAAEAFAGALVNLGIEDEDSFFARVCQRLEARGVSLPEVTIRYTGLAITVKATSVNEVIPSLSNVLKNAAKAAVQTVTRSKDARELTILNDLSGQLEPGRLTLLLGPPSSGKTTFLRTLAGRAPQGRTRGQVTWNGHEVSEFCAARSIAVVSQTDTHIATLTTRETAAFSHAVQHARDGSQFKVGQALERLYDADSPSELGSPLRYKARPAGKLAAALKRSEGQQVAAPAKDANVVRANDADRTGLEGDEVVRAAALGRGALGCNGNRSGGAVLPGAPTPAPRSSDSADSDSGPHSDGSPEAVAERIVARGMTDRQVDELAALMLDGPGRPDLFLAMFGLVGCADTFVGNAMVRGISGGERKRLSTVEMLMSQQRVLVLDEISTGLDSATLFSVIRWLRAMTHHLRTTTIISLLQPPPETYSLFDDVMIMGEGRIVFHGHVTEAVPYFASLGFVLPPRKDVPSFLQEVLTVQGQVLYATNELKQACKLPADLNAYDEDALAEMELLIGLDDMVKALPESQQGALHNHGLANPAPRSMDGLIPANEKYALGPLAALRNVLVRQAKLFVRDKNLVWARLVQGAVVGLLIGGFFFQLGVSTRSFRAYFGAMFLAVMFMSFGGMPQTTMVVQNRGVWFKQRACNMYSASALAWSRSFVQLPMSLAESLIVTICLYFLIGFTLDGAKYFFIFWCTMFLASLSMSSTFRLVGSFFDDVNIASTVAGFVLFMFIVNSGFTIVHKQLPGWVVYFYWLSPYAYAMRNLAINEMLSPRWDGPSGIVEGQRLGEYALREFDFYTDRYWIYVGFAFMVAFFVVCTQLSAVGLALLQPPSATAVVETKEERRAAHKAARAAKAAAEAALAKQQLAADASAHSTHSAQGGGAGGGSAQGSARSSFSDSRRGMSTRGLAVSRSLPFTPISLVWRDLCYYVSVPGNVGGASAANVMPHDCGDPAIAGKKRLINHITGYAKPGVLTALMGGTGAGKTTFMDVLAGRKTQGVITGDLLVNGHPKVQDTWSRVVGYVEQTDVHSSGLTVEESLRFSGAMRLASAVTAAQRDACVQEVLVVTDLLDNRGAMVGEPGRWGLSVEQRRRLSIGVELVANPSVMFLDEPTSGLDARSARAVMSAVRNVTSNGRTVMVTIHQPSIEIFEEFDALVLLAKGGSPIFLGPLGERSSELVRYFESIPGVPKLPDGYNPATWMLEVCGGGAKMYVKVVDNVDFHEIYTTSELVARNAEGADAVAEKDKHHPPLALASRYAIGFVPQVRWLLWKQTLLYWRNPGYNLGRLIGALITGVVFGATFWRAGKMPSDRAVTIADVQSVLGSVFGGLAFMGMTALVCGIPAFAAELKVTYRERAASMYASAPFAIATALIELPYLVAQALVFFPIAYFMIDFQHTADAILLYAVIFLEAIALYTYLGTLYAWLLPTPVLALVSGLLTHLIWQTFNGFLLPRPQMAAGWVWVNYLSGTTWVLYAVGVSQLGNVDQKMLTNSGHPGCSAANLDACPTVAQFMDDYFGYKYSMRWWCALILVGFLGLFVVCAMTVLKVINHQRR